VGVQEEFEKFLQERGINESLALFIPEYAEYKEQKVRRGHEYWELLHSVLTTRRQEYARWLKNVKAFINM
jgi:complement component 1 Q subcomponent-binding protein, mitochondrial